MSLEFPTDVLNPAGSLIKAREKRDTETIKRMVPWLQKHSEATYWSLFLPTNEMYCCALKELSACF